jgi:two-component system response regulator RegA|tara:strand:- start:44 stop:586 length:543 start_codon:yes stop_codon:yes gene_type:complete
MDSEKILLVEDDEVFARVISRALKQRNFSVLHAQTSDEALQLAKGSNFAFGILDLNLGGETSLNLIPILKKQLPEIRILILTGYASIATAVEAIKLGADNYLAKPADADEILSAMLASDGIKMEPNESTRLEPMSVRRLEWEYIQRVLMENNGNISATARQLKMHRRTLQRKLQKRPVAK